MNTIGNRIKALREAKGWSQGQLASACGWDSQGRVSNYERGLREPKNQDIKRIAKALDVSEIQLLTDQTDIDHQLQQVNHGIVPVISWVQAGLWSDSSFSEILETGGETIETTTPTGRRTFALKVKGDSMEPMFPDGSFIIVEPDLDWRSGDYVVIKQNNSVESTFKQIVADGSELYLRPLNSRYPILEVMDDAVICGVVRGMQLKIR